MSTESRSPLELFEIAYDSEGDAYSDVLRELHWSGERVTFEIARAWAFDPDELRRIVGLDVLGQLGIAQSARRSHWPHRPETIELLRRILQDPNVPLDVLESAIVSAGHQSARALLHDVIAFVDHPDDDIRSAVTFAVSSLRVFADDDGDLYPAAPEIVDTLIHLCADDVAEIREWALFHLRILEDDQAPNESPGALAAYLAGVEDEDEDVRLEARQALEALGLRSEPRIGRLSRPMTRRRRAHRRSRRR
ncbi:hypothetical protein OJ997_28690 [Solirubrobacter phytolaccae]|uniref:HEAT repeat domain-containing protein n=1 Tax=Solirubrobacter phytolaccae TaxID=1404360 RepID=A0A9X3NMT7_9ACTN|nr:hypothetical protein [Solirubrobacter phytolaccae]MDA0184317.1 hypothetical protein [Solirubrobacter phytolaccae]